MGSSWQGAVKAWPGGRPERVHGLCFRQTGTFGFRRKLARLCSFSEKARKTRAEDAFYLVPHSSAQPFRNPARHWLTPITRRSKPNICARSEQIARFCGGQRGQANPGDEGKTVS